MKVLVIDKNTFDIAQHNDVVKIELISGSYKITLNGGASASYVAATHLISILF